jgi:hypothetical protein
MKGKKKREPAIRFYHVHGFEGLGSDTFTIGVQTFDFAVLVRRLTGFAARTSLPMEVTA